MKISNKIIGVIKEDAKSYFKDASSDHDWSHIDRVYNLALKIAKNEKADLNVVKIAVYLHDIGRKEEMKSKGNICHAERGAELAGIILQKYNFDNALIENVKHCILSHRSGDKYIPQTIEAKILFDADKLDSIGAIGVARDFLFAGYLGHVLYTGNEKETMKDPKKYSYTEEDTALLEYYYKLSKVKSGMMTKTGRTIAKERDKYMADFFKRFEKEIKGIV